jgi:AcrR family transcriptional regulator
MARQSETEPVRLSREVIVEAYLRIADAEGTDDITLRRLGRELGVDPTAVYRHFRDKDEILAVASDRVLADATQDLQETGSWRDDIRALQLGVRRAYLRHPKAMLALQLSPAPLSHAARLSDRALGLLRDAGLDEEQAALAYEVLEDYTIGTALFDTRATDDSLDGWRRVYAAEPVEEYPHLVAASRLLYRDAEAAFAFGLDLMLEAIETRYASARPDDVPTSGDQHHGARPRPRRGGGQG